MKKSRLQSFAPISSVCLYTPRERFLVSIPHPLSWDGLERQIKSAQEGEMESVLKPTVVFLSFTLQQTFTQVDSSWRHQALAKSPYW